MNSMNSINKFFYQKKNFVLDNNVLNKSLGLYKIITWNDDIG